MEKTAALVDYRERDKAIFRVVDNAAVILRHLVELGLFITYQTANRRSIRLRSRKRGRKLRVIGQVAMQEVGRLCNVYCSYRPKAIEHEVWLSDELVKWPIDFTSWKRGIETDEKLRPDAQVEGLMIEYDRGTERKKQVQKQAEAYRNYTGLVVWVVPSPTQVKWISEVAWADNTMFKFHRTAELFDDKGRQIDLKKLCSSTLN